MAGKHEQIVNDLIITWSVQGRGRLFKNHTGGAWMCNKVISDKMTKDPKTGRLIKIVTLFNARFIKYGLRAKDEKLVDLVGFEVVEGRPVWCVIEVKTDGYSKITKEQKNCLDMAVRFGGRAYVARESVDGYSIDEWMVK